LGLSHEAFIQVLYCGKRWHRWGALKTRRAERHLEEELWGEIDRQRGQLHREAHDAFEEKIRRVPTVARGAAGLLIFDRPPRARPGQTELGPGALQLKVRRGVAYSQRLVRTRSAKVIWEARAKCWLESFAAGVVDDVDGHLGRTGVTGNLVS
jgi:hypothetical protein